MHGTKGLMDYLNKVGAILWKDLITEVRSKEMLISMFTFAFLVVVGEAIATHAACPSGGCEYQPKLTTDCQKTPLYH